MKQTRLLTFWTVFMHALLGPGCGAGGHVRNDGALGEASHDVAASSDSGRDNHSSSPPATPDAAASSPVSDAARTSLDGLSGDAGSLSSPEAAAADAGGLDRDGNVGSSSLPPPRAGAQVVFDLDFTKGKPESSSVSMMIKGGKWEDGWRAVAKTDQIIIDAGRFVANGALEATFTMKGQPWAASDKLDWLGIFENPQVSQGIGPDLLFLRTGAPKYGFSMVKAYGKAVDQTEWHEHPSGAAAEAGLKAWITDDSAEMTVKLEWDQGVAAAFVPPGTVYRCPVSKCNALLPVDRLRYVSLARDGYSNQALVGIRFRRVRLVEYARP